MLELKYVNSGMMISGGAGYNGTCLAWNAHFVLYFIERLATHNVYNSFEKTMQIFGIWNMGEV